MNIVFIDAKEEVPRLKNVLDFAYEKKKNSHVEFEFRIFDAGKIWSNPAMIVQLKKRLQKIATRVETVTDTVYSKGNMRKIVGVSDSKYQEKIKDKSATFDIAFVIEFNTSPDPSKYEFRTVATRFAKSLEVEIDETVWRQSSDKEVVRNRSRDSFIFDNFQIDVTIVNDVLEVEVEFLTTNFDVKSIMTSFKSAFLILFPTLHTIFSKKMFETAITTKFLGTDLKELIQATDKMDIRPVNIQISKHVNSGLQNYAATNKLDGVAYNLLLGWNENNELKTIVLFNSKDVWIKSYPTKIKRFVIIKVEVVDDELWGFDALSESENIVSFEMAKRPLNERLMTVTKVSSVNVDPFKLKSKTFFYSVGNNNFSENVKRATQWMVENYGLYDCIKTNDGLIFEPLTVATREQPTLKWKFPSRVGIDFKLELKDINMGRVQYYLKTRGFGSATEEYETIKTPKKESLILDYKWANLDNKKIEIKITNKGFKAEVINYQLKDGVKLSSFSDITDVKKREENKIVLAKLVKDNQYELRVIKGSRLSEGDYFLIDSQKAVLELPAESSVDGFSAQSLNDFIVELGWKNNAFYPMRVRTDKQYANGPKVAIETFQDMRVMLTLPTIIQRITSPLDQVAVDEVKPTETKCLENYRKLHNTIKQQLITTFANDKVVLDLGIGKGGDLWKYMSAKVQRILGIEPNFNFYKELESRVKDNAKLSSFYKNKLVVLPEVGGQDWQAVEKFVVDHLKSRNTIDVIFMMFSLTYFFGTSSVLKNLAKTISLTLKSEGKFVATFMNGYLVRKELEKLGGVIEDREKCWKIKAEKVAPVPTFGDEVMVDLKATETAKDLTEWLVYLNFLTDALAEEKQFSFLRRYQNFSSLTKGSDLTESETQLNNFYSYCTFELVDASHMLYRNIYWIEGSKTRMIDTFLEGLIGPSFVEEFGTEVLSILKQKLTFEVYCNLISTKSSVVMGLEKFCKTLPGKDQVVTILKTEKKKNCAEILNSISDDRQYTILRVVLEIFHKRALKQLEGIEMNEFLEEYLTRFFGYNIMFIDNKGEWKGHPKEYNIVFHRLGNRINIIKFRNSDTSVILKEELLSMFAFVYNPDMPDYYKQFYPKKEITYNEPEQKALPKVTKVGKKNPVVSPIPEEDEKVKIKENYKIDADYIKFYSNATKPYYKLSNFAYIKDGIEVDGIVYPSTEHAFQAQKFIQKDRQRFSTSGDIGKISTGFRLVYPKESKVEVDKKRDFWMKKENIGILAKMASDEEMSKKLGLTRVDNFLSSDEQWMKILRAKYSVKEFRDILMSTDNHYILEFEKSAKRRVESGDDGPYYAGLIDDDDKYKLYGKNKMGIYLMNIRDSLK